MKTHPALAAIEFSDIPAGILATDALLKQAPIAFIRCGTITHGRFLTLFGGTTAAVEESFAQGLRAGGSCVIDRVLLPDVHPELYAGVQGSRNRVGREALALVETATAAASLLVAEAALKGTPVSLIEIRLADGGLAGKGVSIYQGALHDLEAAMQLAEVVLQGRGQTASTRIIPAPADALLQALAAGTRFASAAVLELDGEGESCSSAG
ncbi:MAG: BMC domain-containing protein [Acidobacteriota bacterium]